MMQAASDTISGLRLCFTSSSPPSRFCTAAVAIVVFGHNAFTDILNLFSSADKPSTIILIPYLLIVYARCFGNHLRSMFSGGEMVRMCADDDCFKNGMHALLMKKVPRTLISCIR